VTAARGLLVLALGGFVLTAGCSGPGATGSQGGDELTPAPVPTDRPTDEDRLPPGLARESVDVGALARAHAGALAGRTYRTRVDVDWTVRGASGTVRARTELRRVLRVRNGTFRSASGRWIRNRSGGTHSPARPHEYVGAALEPVASGPASDSSSAVNPVGDGVLDLWRSAVGQYLAASEVRVGRGSKPGATRTYRVVASGNPYGLGDQYGGWDARNYVARAVVEPSGLVRLIRVEFEVPTGNGVTRLAVEIRLDDPAR